MAEHLGREIEQRYGRVPNDEEAALILAAVYSADILREPRLAYDKARDIWFEAYERVPGAQDELREFVGLASEWQDHPEHRVDLENDIVALATEFLKTVRVPLDERWFEPEAPSAEI
jgi:hypothetical protein